MAQVINATFRLKRGTTARWAEVNPILDAGEPGFVYDENRLKIGDGITAWNDLPYIDEESGVFNFDYVSDFPAIGNENIIYKAEKEQSLYQFNTDTQLYEKLSDGIELEYLANEIASKEDAINVEPKKILVSDDNGKLCASETSLEDISVAYSSLAPGSITWNRDLEGRTIFQAGEQDGMEYGYVKVSDVVFTPEQFQLLSYSGFKPILGAWVENRYISWEAEIQKIDESVDIGYVVLPEDESEQLGAMILSSDFMGVTAGVYFAVVQDLGYAIAAVTNLQIPGYGHAQSQAISTHVENTERSYKTDTLVWDGTKPDLTINMVQFKRIADPIPIKVITDNQDSLLFYVNVGGEIVAEPHTPRIGENYCYFSYAGLFPAFVITYEDNVTPANMTMSIPKAGTYFMGVPSYSYFGCALSIKNHMFTITMNQEQPIIDNKHLPEYLQLGEVQEEYTIIEDVTVELGDTLLRSESIRLPYDRPSPSAYFAADYIDIEDDVIVTATNEDGTVITLTKDGNSYINENLRYMVIISDPNETLIPTATDVKAAIPGVYLIENGYNSLVSVTAAGVNFTRTDKQFAKKVETKTKVLDEKYLPDLITVEDIDIICGIGGSN